MIYEEHGKFSCALSTNTSPRQTSWDLIYSSFSLYPYSDYRFIMVVTITYRKDVCWGF